MRWLHLSVIALFVGALIVFAAQNLQLATMSFLGFRATVPLALLAGIIYVLGMAQAAASSRYSVGSLKGQKGT